MNKLEELKALLATANFGKLSKEEYGDIWEQYSSSDGGRCLDVRGWGRLQYEENGEQIHDARGDLIVLVFNELLMPLIAVAEAAKKILECGDLQWRDTLDARTEREDYLRFTLGEVTKDSGK